MWFEGMLYLNNSQKTNEGVNTMLPLTEDRNLYRGIFWIPDIGNVQESKLFFQIPCNSEGTADPGFSISTKMSSKGTDNYNHKNVWRTLPKSVTNGHDYNYYPRGRVEIRNGTATIYASPHIPSDELIGWVVNKFNLTSYNGIKKVKYMTDGSDHYKCYLD